MELVIGRGINVDSIIIDQLDDVEEIRRIGVIGLDNNNNCDFFWGEGRVAKKEGIF